MYKIVLLFLVAQVYGFILPDGDGIQETFDLFPRIVGGTTAPEGKIPYQVSLRNVMNSHFCGGSVINKRWILTAAHCTTGQSTIAIRVVVGTNSLTRGGERYFVDKIIIHKDYDANSIKNDISLIRLTKNIELSDKVQPIALPEENTGADKDLLLSGWGRTSYPGSIPTQLQMIQLKSLSVERCQEIYKKTHPIYDTQICSLTKSGEGACHGDSGGPLVEGNAVVGIVSWGMPCARGYPDVYTRVFSYKDWIQEQISKSKPNEILG